MYADLNNDEENAYFKHKLLDDYVAGNNLDDHLNGFAKEFIREPQVQQGRYSRGISPVRQSYDVGTGPAPFFNDGLGPQNYPETDRYPYNPSPVMNGSYTQPVIQPIIQPPQFNVNPMPPYSSMVYPNYTPNPNYIQNPQSMEASILASQVEKQTQLLEAIKSKLEKPGSESSRRRLDSRELDKRLREMERENELKLQLARQQQMIELLSNNQYQQKADLFPKYYDPLNNYGVRPQGNDLKDKIIEQQAQLLQNLLSQPSKKK